MNNNTSLQRYLLVRLGALVAMLILLVASLMVYVLFYSHDDSAEYYMQYEALALSEHYLPDSELAEFDAQIKEYYWHKSHLPDAIQTLVNDAVVMDKLNWYKTERFDIYVYPHSLTGSDKGETFWVVHYFLKNDLGEGFYFSRNLVIGFVLLILALLLVSVVVISIAINNQLQGFANWITQIAGLEDDTCTAPEYQFSELQQAAFELAKSINAERQLQKQKQQFVTREKAFLSTLSHELRTPMAVINTAIALLNKRGDLGKKDANTLLKLATANDKMKLLSTSLLALWRKTPQSDHQVMLLGDVVNTAIEAAQQVNTLEVEVNSLNDDWQSFEFQNSSSLLQLLLDNLLRNASQYSADGKACLSLKFEAQQLVSIAVENPVTDAQSSQGYGLGLYLVEEICQQQQWQLQTNISSGQFYARVSLTKAEFNQSWQSQLSIVQS